MKRTQLLALSLFLVAACNCSAEPFDLDGGMPDADADPADGDAADADAPHADATDASDGGTPDGRVPPPENLPPAFVTDAPSTAIEGTTYLYGPAAEDPEGEPVTYALSSGPPGLEMVPETGVVLWAVPEDAAGSVELVITAADPYGASTAQRVRIEVAAVNRAPRITSTPPTTSGTVGAPWTYAVTTLDPDGDEVGLEVRGEGFRVEGTNVRVTPSAPGVVRGEIIARDPSGATDRQAIAVGAASGSDFSAPIVSLQTPTEGATIRSLVEVVGTVRDPGLVEWRLEGCQPLDAPTCITVARGVDEVNRDTLGTLDASPFLDEPLLLRLSATDADGNRQSTERQVDVDSGLHLGQFGVGMMDLTVKVDNDLVTIGREYDTRRRGVSDFGLGWDIASNIERGAEVEPTVNVPADFENGWRAAGGGLGRYLESDPGHFVELTLPSGDVYVFQFTPDFTSFASTRVNPIWSSPPGTTIETVTDRGDPYGTEFLQFLASGGRLALFPDVLEPYEPPAFRIGLGGGREVVISRERGLISSTGIDLTGPPVGVELRDDGVYGSTGRVVEFVRATDGRIDEIYDARFDRRIRYTYDGDLLTQVIYPDDGRATFEYEEERLVRWTLPDGYGLTRVEFDLEGRVVRRVFPSGRVAVFEYDDEAGRMVLMDGTGARTTFDYDASGNVTRMVDGLGNATEYRHDAGGRLTWQRDALGRVSRFGYTASGLLTSRTLPGQGTWTAGYTDEDLTRVTDAYGRTFRAEAISDTVSRIVGPNGSILHEWMVDDEGRVIRERVGGVGTETEYDYASDGQLRQIRSSDGDMVDVTHAGLRTDAVNADGQESFTRQAPDGTIAEIGDGTGASTTFSRDFMGHLNGIETPDGRASSSRFDAEGRRISTSVDGEEQERRQYDGAGRLVLVTNADGWFERTRYDDAGRITSKETPEGTRSFAYDAAGTVIEQTFPSGRRVALPRDEHGRIRAVEDSSGRRVAFDYDDAGRIVRQEDTEGWTEEFGYDPTNGLPVRYTTPCGTSTVTYDTRLQDMRMNEMPPVTSLTDTRGATWGYRRDVTGRLDGVDYPDDVSTAEYRYDADGELSEVRDANGNAWGFVYESGRLTEATTPEGLRTTTSNVGADTVIVRPDSSTETIRFEGEESVRDFGTLELGVTADEHGRVVRSRAPADDVTYEYDDRGRLITVTHEDGATARYEWDPTSHVTAVIVEAEGETARTEYEYDPMDRVVAITDPAGGRTTYSYTRGQRRPSAIARPNGVTTTIEYSPSLRPTLIVHTGPDATELRRTVLRYDAACRLVEESSGDGRVTYDYDPSFGWLTEVTWRDSAGAVVDFTRYGYDGMGNRTRVETMAGGVTRSTFDRDGRLTGRSGPAGATTYEYDGRGNLTRENGPSGERRYAHDEADRLTEITEGGSTERLSYDAQGLLVEAGTARRCLGAPRTPGSRSGCLAYYGGGGGLQAVVMGPTGIVADWTAAGSRHVLQDALGSVVGLTDSAGASLGEARYDGYGTPRADSLPSDFPYRYRGEVSVGGMTFLRSRWYAPHLGVFAEADGASADTEDPRSLHRYLYALGDPVNRVDPLGTFSVAEINVTIGTQNQMRARNQAAQMRARCFAIGRVRSVLLSYAKDLLLGYLFKSVQDALLQQIGAAALDALGENKIDALLRKFAFCGNDIAGPIQQNRTVRFQVDVDHCGRGGRVQAWFGSAASNWMTCANPFKLTPPWLRFPGAGVDFLVGGRVVGSGFTRQIEGGFPIELKIDEATQRRRSRKKQSEQLVRYCRYVSRRGGNPLRMMTYVFYRQIPSEVYYGQRFVECIDAWSSSRSPRCSEPGRRPYAGGVLIFAGRDRSIRGPRRRHFRVYVPNPRGLCN